MPCYYLAAQVVTKGGFLLHICFNLHSKVNLPISEIQQTLKHCNNHITNVKKTTTLKPTMSKINHHPPTPKVFLFYMKHFYSVKPFRIWRLSKNQSPELWNPLLKMFDNYTFGGAAIANVALLISLLCHCREHYSYCKCTPNVFCHRASELTVHIISH